MGHFKRKFQMEGDIAHQPLLILWGAQNMKLRPPLAAELCSGTVVSRRRVCVAFILNRQLNRTVDSSLMIIEMFYNIYNNNNSVLILHLSRQSPQSQKTKMITLSCGVKISAMCSFVSSQSTRVTYSRTDIRTKLRSPRPR